MKGRVLVVDDDAALAEMLGIVLRSEGFVPAFVSDGERALAAFREVRPDIVLLDLMLPGMSGIDICRAIRVESGVPIVMLTAKTDTVDVVLGLESGADDYVVKPFGRQELVARVDVLLRRQRSGGAEETYADSRLSISFAQRAVRYDEREVVLTRLEFLLLSAFVRHPNQVLSQDQLRDLVWGDNLATSRDEVKLYVGYLRRKLAPDDPQSTPIETVRGFGYRYRPPS
jgi:two-component system response regulator MtrA